MIAKSRFSSLLEIGDGDRNMPPGKRQISVTDVSRSHRKYPGEEVGEDRQKDEPAANDDEDPAAPALYLAQVGAEDGYERLLSRADGECQQEHQEQDDQGGVGEGHEGGPKAAQGKGVPGQTGQDRAGSTKPGQQVAEAEQHESHDRAPTAETSLRLH